MHKKINFIMNIICFGEAEVNKIYKIECLEMKNKNIKTQLEKLGFLKNENIQLLKYNYGKKSYLIKVMGINYAIDKSVCDEIFVKDE